MAGIIENALYLVPTPIGNMEDITIRAKRILSECDFIACEDTRRTGLLLNLLELPKKKLYSYHDFNEESKADFLAKKILDGESCALASDCGSPVISDPGYRLVRSAIEMGVKIIPLPGATAFVPALSASGLAVDSFAFYGFPPQKKGRQTFLKMVAEKKETVILYESPNRILKLVNELIAIIGMERRAAIARELSKAHEEFIRGSLGELSSELNARDSIKGEIVFILEGKQ